MKMIRGVTIWDRPDPRMRPELTDLIRFKDRWYCGFREAVQHHNDPSGRARIIRSADGKQWETVALFAWDGADVREPKFSVTAEGHLMANSCLYFCSREPRSDGRYYQLDQPQDLPNDLEPSVSRQSVTWISEDGRNWSGASTCPTGINTWRWEVSWHDGMGYSVAYAGPNAGGTLYRTRDGKNWRELKRELFPEGHGNEASLAFGPDGTAYCLLRDALPRKAGRGDAALRSNDGHVIVRRQSAMIHGTHSPMLGIGKAPYYQDWTWKPLLVDYGPEYGGPRPAEEMLRAPFGGPKLIRLSNGRYAAAGRVLGPGRDDGHITLFALDPERALLTLVAECTGTTYGGIAEHAGRVWISHIEARHPDLIGKPGDERIVCMADVPLPKPD